MSKTAVTPPDPGPLMLRALAWLVFALLLWLVGCVRHGVV